jgi:hypothetical protein
MPLIEAHFCLLRGDDVPPTNPQNLAFRFGLQDTKGIIQPAEPGPDNKLAFPFTLTVKPGKDPARPAFNGRFASGPVDDRFIYRSWLAVERGIWINRIKARLHSIDWKLIHASRDQGRPITADLTGWAPHDNRKFVAWQLG